jgi:hypothetical protein
MATLVGDAYVRVHADTGPFHRELKNERAKMAEDGGAAGKEYQKKWNKAVSDERKKGMEDFRKDIREAFAAGDFSKIQKQMGGVEQATRRVNRELERMLSNGMLNNQQVTNIQRSMSRWAIPARIAEEAGRATRALTLMEKSLENDRAAMTRMINEGSKAWAEIDRAAATSERTQTAAHNKIKKAIRDQEKAFESYAKNIEEGSKGRITKGLRGLEQRLGKVSNGFDSLGDSVGRAFGKGSRNNFFNFFGSMVGAIASLPGLLTKAGQSVLDFGANFGEVFSAAKLGGAGNFSAAMSAIGSSLTSLAPLLAAVVGGFAIFLVLLPPLVAGAFALAGAVVEVAAAIGFALAGALLAAVPLLLAMGPAVIVAVAALKQFSDMRKKGWEKKDPGLAKLVKDFKDLGDAISTSVDKIFKSFGKLSPVITDFLKPLTVATADAIATITSNFGDLMNAPAMKGFLNQWKTALPNIFKSFGLGLNQMLSGIMAFFTPILPFTQRLADAFKDLMTGFNQTVSGAKGQNSIAIFMERAWTAATHLWNILVNLGSALGSIFSSAQDSGGQSFLEWLDGLTKRFADFLKTPEGQKSMTDFFDNAKEAGKKFLEIIGSIGDTLLNMDTDKTRQTFNDLLDAIKDVAGWINTLSTFTDSLWTVLSNGASPIITLINHWDDLGNAFKAVQKVVIDVAGAISLAFLNMVSIIINAAADAFGWVPGLGPKLREAAGKVDAFKDQVNANLRAMDRSFTITADTQLAQKQVDSLQKSINSLEGKTVNVGVRYTIEGRLPSGGVVTKGGSTTASGGLFDGAQTRIIGEAGPEAVVPLDRPLSLVDPAVRALSAIAQGKTALAAGGVVGMGRTINVADGAIRVTTNSANPLHVAMSVLDRLTAAAI